MPGTRRRARLGLLRCRSVLLPGTEQGRRKQEQLIFADSFALGPVAVAQELLDQVLRQRHSGADASAIGRAIELNGAGTTIVGVMPAKFSQLYASPYDTD